MSQRKIIGIITVLFTAAVFLAVLYAPVDVDELIYMDPGANLALGKGWTSTSWDGAAPGGLWGSSTPGFPLFFGIIYKIFGFKLWVARAVIFTLHLVGVLLILRWAHRALGLSAWSALACFIICLGAPSISSHALYRPRLECFALIFCAGFLHARDAWNSQARAAGIWLFLLGVVVAVVGLHFAAFFALVAALLYILDPSRKKFRFGMVLATGIIGGIALIMVVYGEMGVWNTFITHRAAHYGRELPWAPRGISRYFITKDLGIFMVGCLAVLCWCLVFRNDPQWKVRVHKLCVVIAIFFTVPAIMGTLGIWCSWYAWMSALPMMIAVIPLFYINPPWPLRALAVLALSLGLAGAAREFINTPSGVHDMQLRRQAVDDLRGRLSSGEAVASTCDFFYEIKAIGFDVYFRVDKVSALGFSRDLHFPEAESARTKWLITTSEASRWYLEGLGGNWIEVRRYPRSAATGDYMLFRRVSH